MKEVLQAELISLQSSVVNRRTEIGKKIKERQVERKKRKRSHSVVSDSL